MADPKAIAAAYLARLGLHATLTITRGMQSVTTRGRIAEYGVKDLTTGIVQGDRIGIVLAADLSAAGWSPLLDRGDRIAFGDEVVTVLGAAPRIVMDVTVAFDVKLEG